ncbi:putative resolvase [Escherichia coli M605]|uniref:Putative resolvase n=1 Tax=Escherichia coli M605 TaxID=656417 RepID=F4SYE7_ECOLX|nr:helix-turn-helix domain-containing protein [Escherichia coli]EGI16394.1 putative resolvase [Escherichia coli M605]
MDLAVPGIHRSGQIRCGVVTPFSSIKGGRPKSLSKDKQTLAVRLFDERKHTVTQICEIMGISKPTLYKYIAAVKAG